MIALAGIEESPATDMGPALTASPARITRAAAPGNHAARPRQPGRGRIEVQRVSGRSVVTRSMAESPLRLLTPRSCPGNAAWIFNSTFGGGLLAGDQIDLAVRVGRGAGCLLGTQASTKIYRSSGNKPAVQHLKIDAEANSTALVLPDPLTCFAGAIFNQRIEIDLAESASLVLVDCLTSGRRARGERWAFRQYASRIDVRVEAKLVFRDAVRLDEADGPIDAMQRMGSCDCFGIIVLLGPRVAAACRDLLAWAAAQPAPSARPILFAASALPGGAVIRMAGTATDLVAQWIRQRLSFVPDLIGGDPWARKG